LRRLPRCLVALVAPTPATASFGIEDLDVQILNQDGTPATQAGPHPFEVVTNFDIHEVPDPVLQFLPDESAKDVIVELPPGLVGDPTATPKCTTLQLITITASS
jgi:hypothetical protein